MENVRLNIQRHSKSDAWMPQFVSNNKTPKVLLVYPKFADTIGRAVNIPINLLYLGSYLESFGVKVEILDALWHEDFEARLLEAAASATLVGISPMTFQLPHALELSEIIKRHYPHKPLAFGGVHPTLFAEQIIQNEFIDFVVKGEGEIPTLKLLDYLLGFSERDSLSEVAGLCYRNGKSHHISEKFAEQIDYQNYPEVNYSLIDEGVIDGYRENDDLYFPIVTSRGCPYKCTFCINVVVPNTSFRNWTPERVLREFNKINNLLGRKNLKIWVWDEIYLLNRKRNRDVANLILDSGLAVEYTSSARADFFREGFLDIDTLKLLKRSGMHRVSIGVESGSQKVLDYLQKDLPREMILQSADYCNEASIRPSYSFMIGLPGEEEIDISDTVRTMRELSDRLSTWSVVGPQIFRPYPGSTILDDCVKTGWKMPGTNEDWVRFVLEENYSPDALDIPWISSPGMVNTVYFYTALIALSPKKLVVMFIEFCNAIGKGKAYKLIGMLGVLMLSSIGKLRLKFGFYSFFFERRLFGAIRRRYISF